MTTAIYLAHLNPMTSAHVEIIEEQKKENKVVVMPVRFLNEKKERELKDKIILGKLAEKKKTVLH